ncbi:GSCOCG00010094001-RA-CDS [Cotesia congregata]|nr:GSCOCG00010094001-RA-CDS [Cotesia congregata]
MASLLCIACISGFQYACSRSYQRRTVIKLQAP